jgi:hypothetical protein
MAWYVSSTVNVDPDECFKFTTPGIYTVVVPSFANTMTFEIIGSGGGINNTSSTGGNGGYITGTIDIRTFLGQTIHIYVGGPPTPPSFITSSASYITIPTAGPLFVIAGAGGTDGFSNPTSAGHGGGGTFTNNIANGTNATNVGGTGGAGGTNVGGLGAGTTNAASPYISPINSGGSRPVPETYLEAFGGASNTGGIAGPGGNGYTGGGGGGPGDGGDGGGGGGSSYYNSTYTSVTTSYSGNSLPSNVLPGYGRNQTYGYVGLCFTYVPPPSELLVYINSSSIIINSNTITSTNIGNNIFQYSIPYSLIGGYTYLDYVIVGGGGGGGTAHDGSGANSNYAGGGGGSGQIALTFNTPGLSNNGFNYNISGIGRTHTTVNLTSYTPTALEINIGGGGATGGGDGGSAGPNGISGADSSIVFGGQTLATASGGTYGWGGDQPGDNGDNGDGGNGYNTGGGGWGDGTNGSSPSSSQILYGGSQGSTGGSGGGTGAGYGAGGNHDNSGGGGGAGTCVVLTSGARTGGDGGWSDFDPVANATASVQFTGAGGGGGSYAHSDYGAPSAGAEGYAILSFHN